MILLVKNVAVGAVAGAAVSGSLGIAMYFTSSTPERTKDLQNSIVYGTVGGAIGGTIGGLVGAEAICGAIGGGIGVGVLIVKGLDSVIT
jgi:hypothetical protein